MLDAQKVVQVAHPYLGGDVKTRMWSPLDRLEDDLKAALALDLAAESVSATASSDTLDTELVCCVKNKKPLNLTHSLPDSSRTDDSKGLDRLKKSSVDNHQSQPAVEAPVFASDTNSGHLKGMSIIADSEVQFRLLRKMLNNGFACKHGCTFTADIRKWTITLNSQHESCIGLLAEEIYGYKKGGVFEEEVHISSGLAQLLYTSHRRWLYDRLHDKISQPAVLKLTGDNRLAVVALSENTARQVADMLKTCLLRGKVPLTDVQHKCIDSTKLCKKINKIAAGKAVEVTTGARLITVDGIPHDVVCTLTEINRHLYKY